MRVIVKQLDINRGEQGDPWNCPVARAISRALNLRPRSDTVETDGEYARLPKGRGGRARLPKKVTEFVQDFDVHGPLAVAPFTFTMRRLG